MAERLEIPRPARERRRQAERRAETRARILAAVVESIAEVGFQRTTAAEIARRAGVSWGAVQHHFGDKQGILMAVLEDSFNRFAERLGEIPEGDVPLEERVSLFVDRAWEHFGSPAYRSTFEILLHLRGPEEAAPDVPWREPVLAAWNRIWSGFFGDAGLPRHRTVAIQYYATSVLSGLAAMRLLEGPTAEMRRMELGFLKDTLLRELSGAP